MLVLLLALGSCLCAAPAAFGAQYLQGGDLEGGSEIPGGQGSIDHPAWVEEDDFFPSPICSAKCPDDGGSAGPRSGSQWAWFGGAAEQEQHQTIYQDIAFPSQPVTAALSFYVRVGKFDNEKSVLRVKVDGISLFRLDEFNQAEYAGGYRHVVVPLNDPISDSLYRVAFEFESEVVVGEDRTNVNVDDVSVETTYLRDGDFEAAITTNPFEPMYFDSPGWTESANDGFKSPICEVTACGVGFDTREPHSGEQWAYFGFATKASISQTVTTPALADAAVSFFLVADEFINPNARLNLKVDGATRFTLDAANDQLFGDHYRLVTLPLGALPAGSHTVAFDYNLPPGGAASANVDDVALSGTLAPPPGAPPVQPPPIAATPQPQTRIAKLKLLTGKDKSGKPKLGAKLNFSGSGGSGKLKFQCKLDKGKFKACASPKAYSDLKPGKHSFQVRAVDATGATDATPAKRDFQIAAPKRRGAR